MEPPPTPLVQTDRLLLRGWQTTDLDAHAAMCADSQVMGFLGGPLDRFGSWRRMATHAGHWSLRGFGNWVIVRQVDNSVLGHAGLWQPDGWPGIEVSWTLCRDAWGHGYATEAGQAAIEWAWANLDADRLISVIAPANVASIRVAQRLGLHRDRDTELLGKMMAVWALDRPAPKGR